MVELLPEGWVTTDQAQKLTGYNEDHLYRLIRTGKVDARKLGAMWLFDRESLLAYKASVRPGRKPRKTE